MNRDTIKEKFLEAINYGYVYVYEDTLNESDSLFDDLGFDSLDQIELIMNYEMVFNISIQDEEVEHVKTIKDCIDFLEKRLNN